MQYFLVVRLHATYSSGALLMNKSVFLNKLVKWIIQWLINKELFPSWMNQFFFSKESFEWMIYNLLIKTCFLPEWIIVFKGVLVNGWMIQWLILKDIHLLPPNIIKGLNCFQFMSKIRPVFNANWWYFCCTMWIKQTHPENKKQNLKQLCLFFNYF